MDINQDFTSHNLLEALVRYLTDNYEDDLWDSTTRELLEGANDHLGWPKIEWNIDDDTGCSMEELNEH